jgi:hypothetical protein
VLKPLLRAATLNLANPRDDAIERSCHREMRLLVSRLLVDVERFVPQPRSNCVSSSRGIRASTVGLAIL